MMRAQGKPRAMALVMVALALAGSAAARDEGDEPEFKLPKLPKTSTRFYDIYSRLDEDTLAEAASRLTAMAIDYDRRTRAFPKRVKSKLPIYLFDNYDDYLATGATPGSGGLFIGTAVLGVYTPRWAAGLWPLLQHECWHQFVRYSIGGFWPVWLNEGMAEYYAEAIWTGDDLITGAISPYRLKEVQGAIQAKGFLPLRDLLKMDHEAWSAAISGANYDQAWSLVHFLAHAEGDRYRKALVSLIKGAAASQPGLDTFRQVFGPRYATVQEHYEKWWLSRNESNIRETYVRAAVSTMTSFLARAHLQGLKFKSAEEFFEAARDGRLLKAAQANKALWLPETLLARRLEPAQAMGKWTLVPGVKYPELRLQEEGGATFVGAFAPQGSKSIEVTIRSSKP